MAPKLPPCLPDPMYHVTSRGNKKENLFYDSPDYFKNLALLKETKKPYPFKILSYCLMTNHISHINHNLLQILTQEYHLREIIRVLHFGYARSFNHIILKNYKTDFTKQNPDCEVSNNNGIVNI